MFQTQKRLSFEVPVEKIENEDADIVGVQSVASDPTSILIAGKKQGAAVLHVTLANKSLKDLLISVTERKPLTPVDFTVELGRNRRFVPTGDPIVTVFNNDLSGLITIQPFPGDATSIVFGGNKVGTAPITVTDTKKASKDLVIEVRDDLRYSVSVNESVKIPVGENVVSVNNEDPDIAKISTVLSDPTTLNLTGLRPGIAVIYVKGINHNIPIRYLAQVR